MKRLHAVLVIVIIRRVDGPITMQLLPRHVAAAAVHIIPKILLRRTSQESALNGRNRDVVLVHFDRGLEDHETGVETVSARCRVRVLVVRGSAVPSHDVRCRLGALSARTFSASHRFAATSAAGSSKMESRRCVTTMSVSSSSTLSYSTSSNTCSLSITWSHRSLPGLIQSNLRSSTYFTIAPSDVNWSRLSCGTSSDTRTTKGMGVFVRVSGAWRSW